MELSEEEIIEWYFEWFKMKEDLGEVKLAEKKPEVNQNPAPLVRKQKKTEPKTIKKNNGIR